MLEFVTSPHHAHCGLLAQRHRDMQWNLVHSLSHLRQFCRISCSRGDNMPVLQRWRGRWKWLKLDKGSGLGIWIPCYIFTLIGDEVKVVLLGGYISMVWGNHIKMVCRWRFILEQNESIKPSLNQGNRICIRLYCFPSCTGRMGTLDDLGLCLSLCWNSFK